MDNDLLLDLSHLDDPDPPSFGATGAEEAAHLAARHQRSRARLVAGAVLAVVLLAGGLAATLGQDRSRQDLEMAQTPTPTAPESPTTSWFAPPLPSVVAPPSTAVSNPPPTQPDPSLVGPNGPGPMPSPTAPAPTRSTRTTVTTSRPPSTGKPPQGAVPPPEGLRLTLTLDATQIRSGSSVRGVVRFENHRSTIVTLAQPGCGPVLSAGLFDAGRWTGAATCQGIPSIVVPPGASQQVEVQVFAPPALKDGAYDAFAVTLLEEDGVTIHSEGVVVNVVRP